MAFQPPGGPPQPPMGGPPGAPPQAPPGGPGAPPPGGPAAGAPPGVGPGGAPQPPLVKPRDSAIPVNTSVYTPQPEHANVKLTTGKEKPRISKNEWGILANDLYNSINAAISARAPFEQNLREWQEAYDLILAENDDAQFDGSNVRLPYTATQLEALKAMISGTVLVPRMYVVTGRTPPAADTAYEVERFYNSDLIKMRPDGSSYFQKNVNWNHMGLRDGTAVAEILWNRTRKRTYVELDKPVFDRQGNQKFDREGNPVYEKSREIVDIYTKDYAEETIVPIKDFLLIPAESPSIESAAAVARCLWLYEDQLEKMIRAGILERDQVDFILNYAPSGSSDVASDRQGTWDKDASSQIDIGLAQGTIVSKYFKKRGPFKIWRVHSNQYDLNRDGEVEENIFYIHEQSQRLLGFQEYDYPTEQRPFFSYCPFPRPDEFLGYSIIERLAKVQSEMDLQHNTRSNFLIKKMNAPLAVKDGGKIDLKKGAWFQNEVIETEFEGGRPTMAVIEIPDIPIASFEEESLLMHYGDAYAALNQPAVGGQSSGKRSATELRQQSSASGTRMALICNQFRISLAQVINFIHVLNKAYLREDQQSIVQSPDGAQVFTLTLETLMRDYEIGIAGASDPIDSVTRRNETLAYVEKMMAFPFVQADMGKQWYLARLLSEAFGRVDTTQIIGTMQEAKQLQQAQQQAQAQQQQHAEQVQAATGKPPPAPPKHQGPAPAPQAASNGAANG